MIDKKPIRASQNKAVVKYLDGKDRVEFKAPKGTKELIKVHAEQYQPQEGEPGKAGYSPAGSVSAFVYRAVLEAIERDKGAACRG